MKTWMRRTIVALVLLIPVSAYAAEKLSAQACSGCQGCSCPHCPCGK